MDDIVATLIGGAIGEELFRKLAKKRYFLPSLFLLQVVVVELIFMVLTLGLSAVDIAKGREEWVSLGHYVSQFINFHFCLVQPWALLFSCFGATLGTLSYLWHRRQMTR